MSSTAMIKSSINAQVYTLHTLQTVGLCLGWCERKHMTLCSHLAQQLRIHADSLTLHVRREHNAQIRTSFLPTAPVRCERTNDAHGRRHRAGILTSIEM